MARAWLGSVPALRCVARILALSGAARAGYMAPRYRGMSANGAASALSAGAMAAPCLYAVYRS